MPNSLPSKPWYTSQTVIALIIAVFASGMAYATKNPAIEEAIQGESSNITSIIMQVIATVSGVIAMFGRLKATTKLTK